MINITLKGQPIPKARPRLGRGFFYDPQEKLKKAIRTQIKIQCQIYEHNKPFESHVPIEIHMKFFCELPKQQDKKRINLFLWKIFENVYKPDDDNLEKFYKDCLSKIVYEDDKQIISTKLEKYFDISSRTEIYIMAKKTLNEKALEILSLINPQEFIDFTDDMSLISDCLEDGGLEKDNMMKHIQLDAACQISKFADKYAKILLSINKKYAKAWQEFQKELIGMFGDTENPYLK